MCVCVCTVMVLMSQVLSLCLTVNTHVILNVSFYGSVCVA